LIVKANITIDIFSKRLDNYFVQLLSI